MGIFSRFADIVNSNLNALLDKAEDPAKMVRLIIQEMEDTLVEVRSTSARTLAEKKELARRIEHVQSQIADWQQKAELALSKGREDLAKSALVEKRKLEEAADVMEQEFAHLEQQLEKLQEEIAQLQAKLSDAKSRQKSIVMRQQTASSRLEVKKRLDSGKMEDAMARFEQYEQKIDGLESQVEAYDLGKKSLASEIEQLQAEDEVDKELEALKAQLKKKDNA